MEEQNKNPEKKENEVQTSQEIPTECDTYQKLCTDDSGRMLSFVYGVQIV